MGLTSKWQFGMQWRDIFWRWKVTTDNDDVSEKSIIIFIIELGIWVIRASGNFGCNGGMFFGGGRLQRIMMMFQQKLLSKCPDCNRKPLKRKSQIAEHIRYHERQQSKIARLNQEQ